MSKPRGNQRGNKRRVPLEPCGRLATMGHLADWLIPYSPKRTQRTAEPDHIDHRTAMLPDHEIEVRVRYFETDGQGFVHHANYLVYFELARVEQLQALGYDYADLERDGIFLVVKKAAVTFHRPSRFGDTLRLQIRTVRARAARIDHQYRVLRGKELLAEGESTLACIDSAGRVQRLPDFLLLQS